MPATSARAPAKTILFGEHAVVYGFSAIAVPINSIGINVSVHAKPDEKPGYLTIYHTETRKKFSFSSLTREHPTRAALETIIDSLEIDHLPSIDIRITSTIPSAAGLGSSAAFAVALTRAVSNFLGFSLTTNEISNIAYKIEQLIHGTPSGIDNTVIAFNQPILFSKELPHQFLKIKKPINLVIADSGERTLTKKVLAEVREKREKKRNDVDALFQEIHSIVLRAKPQLVDGQMALLGKLMNENHRLLVDLGVSSPTLNNLTQTAMLSGAFGAKMCGGGQGGIITALADEHNINIIRDNLLQAGAISCFTNILSI